MIGLTIILQDKRTKAYTMGTKDEYKQRINELKSIIDRTLTPEITNDYILLDLPYYTNIGDTLIWEGTKEFLKKLPYKCLYASDMNFFIKRKFPKNTVILLQGGGNFGDQYREHTEFRKKIIQSYPQNKVIILPQSVYYESEHYLSEDVSFYSTHKNVIVCTRETYSYEFIKSRFPYNRVLLIPDLAFYIEITKYKIPPSTGKTLFLRRQDFEFLSGQRYHSIPKDAEVSDWPTFNQEDQQLRVVSFIFRCFKFIAAIGGSKCKNKLEDIKRCYFYRKRYVQIGINFLSQYDTIYTTRLHVLILAVLLGKKIYIYNNSTGKLNNFYNSWLTETHNIALINEL